MGRGALRETGGRQAVSYQLSAISPDELVLQHRGFRHPCLPDTRLLSHRDFGIHALTGARTD